MRCEGKGIVCPQPPACDRGQVSVEVIVVNAKPLGFDLILGMNGILAVEWVTVSKRIQVRFGADSAAVCAVCITPIRLEERDFTATFDPATQAWTAAWKWTDGKAPAILNNRVREYPPSASARRSYEQELDKWIHNNWLIPYDECRHGPANSLIPLMAIVQRNKGKVRPVMDFRELNEHIETFTASADVRTDEMRDWRRQGANISMTDLKDEYLQVRVDEALWPYQTVVVKGRKHCLTRLGFGSNVAPQVVKTAMSSVLAQDPMIRKGTSAYIDDILVNGDVVAVGRVERELERFGLNCKPHERVSEGARVLGLKVKGERGSLHWR
uniref:Reverse transcriptase domain-containing protein n=1 Tax=Trichuris muris TaxID=70415 RepID=A0A5S6QF25_TRIMR